MCQKYGLKIAKRHAMVKALIITVFALAGRIGICDAFTQGGRPGLCASAPLGRTALTFDMPFTQTTELLFIICHYATAFPTLQQPLNKLNTAFADSLRSVLCRWRCSLV